jgi:hypothetical protein
MKNNTTEAAKQVELLTDEQYNAYAIIPPKSAYSEVRKGNWSAENFEIWYTIHMWESSL